MRTDHLLAEVLPLSPVCPFYLPGELPIDFSRVDSFGQQQLLRRGCFFGRTTIETNSMVAVTTTPIAVKCKKHCFLFDLSLLLCYTKTDVPIWRKPVESDASRTFPPFFSFLPFGATGRKWLRVGLHRLVQSTQLSSIKVVRLPPQRQKIQKRRPDYL